MVEHYLNQEDLAKLQHSLPKYKEKRARGMNAGMLAERLGLPLQDVLSFLIDSNELKAEQVDFELARIMLYKNSQLQERISNRCGLTYPKLDYALAVNDDTLLAQACNQPAVTEVYSLLPQFVVFTGLLSLPYELSLGLVMALVGVILAVSGKKWQVKSSYEIISKLFEG